MGKSKKKAQQQVTLYYMSIHYGVCTAVDKVLGIFAKEKEAWTGEVSTPTTISINKQELFGGVKKEGGLLGSVHIMPGTETQTMPAALAQKMGRSGSSDCPAYRGITSLFFYRNSFTQGFYWSANAPYVPAVWCKVERAPVGLDPQYAMIEASNAAAPDISGKTYEVTWWQNSYDQALDDQGRMGWGFVDADENLIGSIDWSTYTAPLTWTERTHSAVAPSGAAYARLYVGANRRTGTNNDARFDAITATVDGQPLFVANGLSLIHI